MRDGACGGETVAREVEVGKGRHVRRELARDCGDELGNRGATDVHDDDVVVKGPQRRRALSEPDDERIGKVLA